ncbi:MAG TPA: GC-type dockerin domain-anchored protein [Thermoanaerobaculia bacterium]|nr:GC-type dockerin domain-anchored protein [Thermoanaerobaculia bacterium]
MQQYPVVGTVAPGMFVVAWESIGQDGNAAGLFGRTVCVHGDATGDGVVDVSDVFYLINSLFAGGPAPVGCADVNGDIMVDVNDVFYLINFLFAGGPPPV